MGVSDLDEAAIAELYGDWAGRTPADAAALLEGYPGMWWVAGGWAIDAFTGRPREHGDLDLGLPVRDLPLVRRHLAGRLHLWAAASGTLAPVLPDDRPDAGADTVLPPGCHNLWARRDARSRWEYDLLLTTGDAHEWVFARCPEVRRPWSEVLHDIDGLRYLRPEVQLLHKARARRPKDQRDLEVTAPLLDEAARQWLREALTVAQPGHPWIAALAG